jgi:hypothetical protein
MCWHDRIAADTILQLAYDFHIGTFLETGTFKGVNAKFQSKRFKQVISCEINPEYFKMAKQRVSNCPNVYLFNMSSPEFLKLFVDLYEATERKDYLFIYLDAHFYDPTLDPKDRWVVLKELEELEGFENCIICIHDFDCSGLGHLTYDGIPLDFNLIADRIQRVNPGFYYYCNTKQFSEIHTEQSIIGIPGMKRDEDTLNNIEFTHSTEARKYRGMIYCTPQKLNLSRYRLVRFEHPRISYPPVESVLL